MVAIEIDMAHKDVLTLTRQIWRMQSIIAATQQVRVYQAITVHNGDANGRSGVAGCCVAGKRGLKDYCQHMQTAVYN